MTSHSPLPVGAIKTKALVLLIALIICGAAGAVIFTHLLKAEHKPEAVTVIPQTLLTDLPRRVTFAVAIIETARYDDLASWSRTNGKASTSIR